MIHFNDLYITEDGKNLVVDAEIDDIPVYEGSSINNITVSYGKDCDKLNTVTIYEKEYTVVGDIDGSGTVTVDDLEVLIRVRDMCQTPITGAFAIQTDENGKIHYRSAVYDDKYKPEVDENDEQIYEDYYPNNNIVSLYNKVIKYKGGKLNRTEQFALYIVEQALFPSENNPGDHALPIINEFIDYVMDVLGMNEDNETIDPQIVYDNRKQVYICRPINLLNYGHEDLPNANADDIFLVTVTADYDTEEIASLGTTDCECGWDNNVIRGLAYNDKKLYDTAVNLAGSYGDTCDNNDARKFMDFILRYYAFIYAIKCGDIKQACYYWNNYLKGTNAKSTPRGGGCGCHGSRW